VVVGRAVRRAVEAGAEVGHLHILSGL
jgi:uncharacterized protein (DUF849 family)